MKMCRLCLCQSDDGKIIHVLEHKIQDLATKILECVSVNINSHEELPKCVCGDCVTQIMHWETFRNTCQKSNQLLLNSLSFGYKELDESILNLDVVEIVKEEVYSENINYNEQVDEEEDVYIYLDEEDEDENEKFGSFKDFSEFPNLSHKEEILFYECDICHFYFDNCFDFLDHQYEHKGKDLFKCDKCPETFCTREEIVHHDRTHRIPCLHCGKLILRASMKLHLVKHTGRHKCPECESSCSSKAALKQHIITVHTTIKEHICEVCGKCFSSVSAMRVHNKTHSENRMYPCKECEYAARTASALYIHMSTHATDICICEVCSKAFKSNRNLSDHIRRVHSEIKKHHCSYCTKSFVDKYMLKVHTRWHTNVRPYKCTICTKAFIRSDGLKEHLNTHTKRTLVECSKCSRKFASRQGVARHNCLAVS